MTPQFWEGDKDTNGLITVNRQHGVPQGRSTAVLPANLAVQGQELRVLYLDTSSKTQPEHEGNLKAAVIVE